MCDKIEEEPVFIQGGDSLNTSNIKNEELTALCVVDYFVALFSIGSTFTVTGEDILQRPGCRDMRWATNMLTAMRPAAKLLSDGHFSSEQDSTLRLLRTLLLVSDEEIKMLLTREVAAVFCAADNILATMYHEYIMYRYRTKLESSSPLSKEDRARIRQLRTGLTKFHKLKKTFLRIAFVNDLDARRSAGFDVGTIGSKTSLLHDAMMAAPIVYRYCPRYLTSDWSQITKLRQKYRDVIIEGEKMLIIPDMDFEFNANGKF